MDCTCGSADGCLPGAGTSGLAVSASFCNALLSAAEPPNDVEVVDFLDFFAAEDFGGDFAAEDFAEESDASVDPLAEDFGEESEGSADCDGELAAPLSGVSA